MFQLLDVFWLELSMCGKWHGKWTPHDTTINSTVVSISSKCRCTRTTYISFSFYSSISFGIAPVPFKNVLQRMQVSHQKQRAGGRGPTHDERLLGGWPEVCIIRDPQPGLPLPHLCRHRLHGRWSPMIQESSIATQGERHRPDRLEWAF